MADAERAPCGMRLRARESRSGEEHERDRVDDPEREASGDRAIARTLLRTKHHSR